MTLGVDVRRLRETSAPADAPDIGKLRWHEEPVPAATNATERNESVEAGEPGLIQRLLKRPLFLAVVLIPNLLSILYFGLIASPVYTSTASLMVVNPKQSGPSLSSLLAGASGDSSEQGGYILQSYFDSWEAFQGLAAPMKLADRFREGDFVSRYGGLTSLFRSNDVSLWRYFQRSVNIEIEQKSGIVSLEVNAYDPGFATVLAQRLLADAVHHMDRMNDRQVQDYVASAINRKLAVEKALNADLAELARYRGTTGTYDPKELYLSNLSLMNSLAMRETELKAQRDSIAGATPNNPVADNLGSAIGAVRRDMSSARQAFPALAKNSARYENLIVSRDNHIAQLNQANMAVQEAQASAEKNRYYLNVISNPSQPQTPEHPRRLMWIGGILLATLILWGLLR